jgi:hypothetical protein
VPRSIDEVSDVLGGEIARCAVRAAEQAMLRERIGSQTFAVTDEIFRAGGAVILLQRSHALRGLVAHALAVLTELQCVAGRLDALATIRRVALNGDVLPGPTAGRESVESANAIDHPSVSPRQSRAALIETPRCSTENPIEHALHIPRVRRRHRAQLIEREPVRQFPCRRPELGIIRIMRELYEYRS